MLLRVTSISHYHKKYNGGRIPQAITHAVTNRALPRQKVRDNFLTGENSFFSR